MVLSSFVVFQKFSLSILRLSCTFLQHEEALFAEFCFPTTVPIKAQQTTQYLCVFASDTQRKKRCVLLCLSIIMQQHSPLSVTVSAKTWSSNSNGMNQWNAHNSSSNPNAHRFLTFASCLSVSKNCNFSLFFCFVLFHSLLSLSLFLILGRTKKKSY